MRGFGRPAHWGLSLGIILALWISPGLALSPAQSPPAMLQEVATATPTETATPVEPAPVLATETPSPAPTATYTPIVLPTCTPTPSPTSTGVPPTATATRVRLPDLVVTNIRTLPALPFLNEPFTVVANITNRGLGKATAISWVALFKDSATNPVEQMPIHPIDVNATQIVSFTLTFASPDTPGYHFLFVRADATNVIDESNETNNEDFINVLVLPAPTETPTPTRTFTPSTTPTPSRTPTITLTFTATRTPSPSFTPTFSPSPTFPVSPTPTFPLIIPTNTPTETSTPFPTVVQTPTVTPLGPRATDTRVPPTETPTPTATPPTVTPAESRWGIISVVIGIFLGLLLVAGGILALAPRLQGREGEGPRSEAAQQRREQIAAVTGAMMEAMRRTRNRLRGLGRRPPRGPGEDEGGEST